MICPKCGLETPAEANFCNRCGNPLTAQGNATAAGNASASSASLQSATSSEPTPSSNYVFSSPPDQTVEEILWDEYPSMRTAIPGIAIAVIIGLAIIIALQVFPITGSSVVQLSVTIIVLLLVIFEILRHYIRLHSIKYRLSTQRIFVTHGLVNKRTDEVELEKYKDIFVNQDFWDNIVGCGDIEIVTSDATNPTIRIIDVADPIGKKETIRNAARQRKSILGITRREEL